MPCHLQVLYEVPEGVEIPPAAAAVSSVEDDGEVQLDSESSKDSDG
jgi:hypothetical protein